MVKVLSTKILPDYLVAKLSAAGLNVSQYNAISTSPTPFICPNNIDNAIITSKNAAIRIADEKIKIKHCYCVGSITKVFLEQQGYIVSHVATSAKNLLDYLLKNFNATEFYFFSGSMRLPTIPDGFTNSSNVLKEIQTYTTQLIQKKITNTFQGILFFSPSAVSSYYNNNKPSGVAFCIGETTATEALKHTNSIKIAAETTLESVVAATINTLIKND